MTQWLRILTTLPEDLGSFPSPCKPRYNYSFRGYDALFWLSGTLHAHGVWTHMQAKHSIHIKHK